MSLFEDFNRLDSTPTYHESYETSESTVLETGFVNIAPKEEDAPMFALVKVQMKLGAGLCFMVVSNNIICMALDNNHVLRIDLARAQEIEDIEISRRPEDKISKLFLDPTGKHLVIGMDNGENLYLNQKWKRPKVLSKFKGVVIESIAWNKAKGGDASTREILVGSSKGQIFETAIEPTDEFFKKEDKYFKQVYKIDEPVPITSLSFEIFPGSSKKYVIMATTPTRLYQFIGNIGPSPGPIFDAIFQNYLTNPGFMELPGDLPFSELTFYSQFQGLPKYFAWLTAPGIYHGNIVFGSQETLTEGATLMQHPILKHREGTSSKENLSHPISISLTEFHFVLLYPDRAVCVSRLNQEKVFEEFFPPRSGKVHKLAFDSINNTYWAYTSTGIFEMVITKEDRNVWELYLEKKQFDTALQYCKDAAQKNKVYTTQADYFFSQERYQLAATYYAQTQKSFEEIALKFITKHEKEALKTFLMKKLETLKPQDATQITIISTWLLEIYLNQLDLLKDEGNKDSYKTTQEEFRQFLSQGNVKEHLNPATTYNLISSHGRVEEMLYYASLVEDYERVISYHIQQGDFEKALVVMEKQPHLEIYYKFSPILMENVPYETVNVWMREDLDPKALIPSLMKYKIEKNRPGVPQNQAIRYLQHCLSKSSNRDPVIFNLLLSLYTQQDDDTSLLAFLSNDAFRGLYDLQYALRLCTQHGKTRACIVIYSAMGLYEEAVELALKYKDLEQAKENAEKPEDDDALKKKLWLRIARHVVEEEKNIKKAMAFLKECNLLKIEDVLPFFSDFVLIDDFKDEICAALEEYNRHIDKLKQDMDEATDSAEAIRIDIRELRNKYGIVSATAKCNLCSFSLLTRQFYLFPCQHHFHAECLTTEVMKHLNNAQKQRVMDLQDKINKDQSTAKKTSAADELENVAPTESNQLRANLDDLVASECVLCGDIMIKSVEKPFITDSEIEIIRSWEL